MVLSDRYGGRLTQTQNQDKSATSGIILATGEQNGDAEA